MGLLDFGDVDLDALRGYTDTSNLHETMPEYIYTSAN